MFNFSPETTCTLYGVFLELCFKPKAFVTTTSFKFSAALGNTMLNGLPVMSTVTLLKPTLETVNFFAPPAVLIEKLPSASVSAVTFEPSNLTVANGTTAPFSSTTFPLTPATCANRADAVINTTKSASTNLFINYIFKSEILS